ncbi:hypothetical protein [Thalassoroseus pseudoceratinae]|uniref:hypothetical protein n=1 Tax=Thalassoroseus pseudoceratinae TaxID=2713176 RepID=UPI00141EE0B6|nr:hypothetical protein [Thalassoroseus pseudoceratinae]
MDLERLCAQAYILQTIGELDEKTSKQLMAKLTDAGAPYESVEEALRSFEREESVRSDVVEWIHESWEQASGQKPTVFAKGILDDFMEAIG